MTDPINLDRLKEELARISPWPWSLNTEMNISNIYGSEIFYSIESDQDGAFAAKAPETIAALVKEMKSLQWKVDYYKRQLAGLGWKDNQILKRGSDEV